MGEEVLKAAERLNFAKAKLLTLLGGYRDDMDEAAVRGFQEVAKDLAEIENALALTRPSPSEDAVERVRDYVYDCTKDEFGHGWTLSAEQTKHVIKLALSAMTQGDEWQDIESAPRDGTRVLIGYFRENLDGSIYEEGGEPIVARWTGRPETWVARRERLNAEGPFSPSHWRPLPAPPRQAALASPGGESLTGSAAER